MIRLPFALVLALKRVNLLVRARLKAAGLDVVEPRRSQTVEGRGLNELAFTDPDGHLVVLYELD